MNGLVNWLDERFPLVSTWKAHFSNYYAPKNFNFLYFFGIFSTDSSSQSNHYWLMANHVLYAKRGAGIFFS